MAELPDWSTPLAGAQRMRAIDAHAIGDLGIPGIELMARAGLAVARAAEAEHRGGRLAVVCGKGNNGGDGLFAAKLLRQSGLPVEVLCTGALREYRGDALAGLAELPGEQPIELAFEPGERLERSRSLLGDCELLIDALLGTGFAGAASGAVARAIAEINAAAAAGATVLSVDLPSGVDGSSGEVAGEAIRARLTVTFQLAKPGLYIAPGKEHAGSVQVADIGIPAASVQHGLGAAGAGLDAESPAGLIEPRVVGRLPRRTRSSTKFSSGHLVLAGGSPGIAGAVALAARAAARAGAGYVSACVPESLQAQLAAMLPPEVMTRGYPEQDSALAPAAAEPILRLAGRGACLALGNGLGRSEPARRLARELAGAWPGPLLLDADGINAHAGSLEALRVREQATVLTPHEGELSRLLQCEREQIQAQRLRHVRIAAERSGAIVILKGDDTLIAAPGGPVLISRGNAPGLATAGTGDVLAGAIGALLAAGAEPLQAAAAGVWLHVRAGRIAARRQGVAEGVLAGDVIAALPVARSRAMSLAGDIALPGGS